MRPANPPDLVAFCSFLGERFGCEQILSIEPSEQITSEGSSLPIVTFGEDVSRRLLAGSSMLLGDLRRADDPADALRKLKSGMDYSPVGVVGISPSARDQDQDLDELVAASGLRIAFRGHTRDVAHPDSTREMDVLVVENADNPISLNDVTVPDDFTVVAFVIVYNEEDIIVPSLQDLFENGVQAYVIDNWSTDSTYDLAREFVGRGVLGIEKSPAGGPPEYFDLKALLTRVEELTTQLEADWYIKHDADEIRRSPWPGVPLRTAMWRADQAGFNCLDFTVANFRPVDNGYQNGTDFADYFRFLEFGKNPGHFVQHKAWKNFGQEIDYARFGSHRIEFPGLRLFPYKFLLRHYPVRSQSHGEKKVFGERQTRFLPEARRRGWHHQYDALEDGHSFLVDPSTLIPFEDGVFEDAYLVERLSGVGLERILPQS